ncbi:hypothetical protein E6R60_14465 [Streptomyces sp. A0642]|uniref:hypothetical protein n=1 Tax=unclassified Streptomyces TaxID=2593676 RepID=UPI0010A25264|nr:hypothetical protein [Streptomyces sp. A0642]THA75976.1 hypothetical protein E6R60_14465 [Streptomyces sp. A0642]
MTDRRPEGTAYTGAKGSPPPVPADIPDQQVQEGEDPLDVVLPPDSDEHTGDAEPGRPDPDEAGSGRNAARNAGTHAEHPTPDESTG